MGKHSGRAGSWAKGLHYPVIMSKSLPGPSRLCLCYFSHEQQGAKRIRVVSKQLSICVKWGDFQQHTPYFCLNAFHYGALCIVCKDKLRPEWRIEHERRLQSVTAPESWAEWVIWCSELAFQSMVFTQHCFGEHRGFPTVTVFRTLCNLRRFTGTPGSDMTLMLHAFKRFKKNVN